MSLEYFITYKAENHYESMVNDAHWQFLIIPEHNINQEFITVDFKNSIDAYNEHSINGYGLKPLGYSQSPNSNISPLKLLLSSSKTM